jgi:hypothetical protein
MNQHQDQHRAIGRGQAVPARLGQLGGDLVPVPRRPGRLDRDQGPADPVEQVIQAPAQGGIAQREQLGLRDRFRAVLHRREGRQHLIPMAFAQLGQDRLENRVHPGQRGHAGDQETWPPAGGIDRYISRNVLSCAAFHAATRGPSRIIGAPSSHISHPDRASRRTPASSAR